MKIKVNGEVVEIFKGAQVKDVIRSYSESEYKKVKKGEKIIEDPNGNMVMPNGELMGNEEFFLVDKKKDQ